MQLSLRVRPATPQDRRVATHNDVQQANNILQEMAHARLPQRPRVPLEELAEVDLAVAITALRLALGLALPHCSWQPSRNGSRGSF